MPPRPGNTLLKKHLNGERLTRGQAIVAKCADCSGYYVDGLKNCGVPECPLCPYMPYSRSHEQNTDKTQGNPTLPPGKRRKPHEVVPYVFQETTQNSRVKDRGQTPVCRPLRGAEAGFANWYLPVFFYCREVAPNNQQL